MKQREFLNVLEIGEGQKIEFKEGFSGKDSKK